MNERDVSRPLAARENGTCEVKTPVGFIDVLTSTTVYEVKEVGQWKAAVGQVLAYARYYPQHTAKIYLYGTASGAQKAVIREHCAALNVQVVWHREPQPDDAVPAVPKPTTIVPDSLSLLLSVFDQSYHVRSTCTFWLRLPELPLTRDALQSYLDAAYIVFDALLDNDLTLTLRYRLGGEALTLQRQRLGTGTNQNPVCYRLNVSLLTERGIPMSLSLPAIRRSLPSGRYIERYPYQSSTDVPELAALFAFIMRPDVPWMNKLGERVTGIRKASWISYGMKQTRNGWKIGGR